MSLGATRRCTLLLSKYLLYKGTMHAMCAVLSLSRPQNTSSKRLITTKKCRILPSEITHCFLCLKNVNFKIKDTAQIQISGNVKYYLVKAFSRIYCKRVTVSLSIIPPVSLNFIFYMKNTGSAWFAWNFKQFKYDFRS